MDIFDIQRVKSIFPFFQRNELTDVFTILIYIYNKLRLRELKCVNYIHNFHNWKINFDSNILLHMDSEKIILSEINKNYDIFNDKLIDILVRNRRKYNMTNKIKLSHFRIIHNNIQFTINIATNNWYKILNAGIFLISYY